MDRDATGSDRRSPAAAPPTPQLSPVQWAHVKEVFHEAVERPIAERPAFVRDHCSDATVASAVERLLAGDDAARSFLETPAAVAMGNPSSRDTPALAAGQRLGAYLIVAPLGAGGMGEVYSAHDTRLGRDVAIKVLPTSLAAHPERLARFDREARVLAALNHRNIATIHGIEDVASDTGPHIRAIVMELIDGDTLAQRLASGPLPLAEALAIARQMADALDAAHERGIIHRDLKPANVKITADGTVKLLDFGLAKAASGDGATADLTQSPTMTIGATHEGVVLGTAAYMSPEQARGRPVDKRADIWAFGCVLYEMLTGRPAFAGETVSDTIAAILQTEPEWPAVVRESPHVWRLLVRCLEKNPKARLRDIGDVPLGLEDASTDTRAGVASGRNGPNLARRGTLFALLGGAVGIAVGRATDLWPRRRPAASDSRFESWTQIVLPRGQSLQAGHGDLPIAVSKDGTRIAWVGESVDGQLLLYVKDTNAPSPRPIPGTEGARHPFFSPDGKWLAYFANRTLYKVQVTGGAPLPRCRVASNSRGGSWGDDETIVFASDGSDLQRLDRDSGSPKALKNTQPAAWPDILPNGKGVLFTHGAGRRLTALAVVPLEGGPTHVVARLADSPLTGPDVLGTGGTLLQARYIADGHLVYGQSPGNIQAIAFDLKSQSIGLPVSIVDSVERARNAGGVYFDVSRTGYLVYAPTGEEHQLVWVDPRTKEETFISPDRKPFRNPRLSPDETKIAVGVTNDRRVSEVWIYDVQSGQGFPLAKGEHNLNAVWNPGGEYVTFSADGKIVEMSLDGKTRRDLVAAKRPLYPLSWSSDGLRLLYQKDVTTGFELWMADWSSKTAHSSPLAVHEYNPEITFQASGVDTARFFRDSSCVAYESDTSGRVHLGRVARGEQLRPVASGNRPVFSLDGRELFYRRGRAVMAAKFDSDECSAGKSRYLFSGYYRGESQESSFDVAKDGRFLMVKSDDDATLECLAVWQNVGEELKRRAAASGN